VDKLGVDVTWLPHDRRGMGRYVASVLDELLKETGLTLFSRADDEAWLRARWPSAQFHFANWNDGALDSLDACWFPWNRIDVTPRCACVLTLHDMAAFDWPVRRPLGFLDNRKAQQRIRKAASTAGRIMTVSEFSRERIVHHLQIPPQRIDVVSEGVDLTRFCPAPSEEDGTRFVLFVGAQDPRKNLDGLLLAWERVTDAAQLWIAGCDGPSTARVRYLGETDDARLVSLYRGCALFVMPSFYEGFGLPLLEAMACGAPVAAACAGSLPEVGGEVAAYFDPKDPDDMGRVLDQALKSPRPGGVERAREFTWARAARQVLDALGRRVAA